MYLKVVQQGCVSVIIPSCNFVDQLGQKFHRLVILCILLEFEVTKSSIWMHTNSCVFFHCYFATLTTNWGQVFTGLLFCICWDIPSEKTDLWQLPKLSSAFNHQLSENIYDTMEPIPRCCILNIVNVINTRQNPSSHNHSIHFLIVLTMFRLNYKTSPIPEWNNKKRYVPRNTIIFESIIIVQPFISKTLVCP